jgi:hypothetical protein
LLSWKIPLIFLSHRAILILPETLEVAVITQGIITAALQVDVMKLAVRQEQAKSATAFATEACATHNATCFNRKKLQ